VHHRQSDPQDLRDLLFREIEDRECTANIWSVESGVISGIKRLVGRAEELGLDIDPLVKDGDEIAGGKVIARIEGTPKGMTLAEDYLIGLIAKTSGIATAARKAVKLSEGRIRIVSGGWKKMPEKIKEEIREAIANGGAGIRILDEPFVYLDKNYVRIFGGIGEALRAASIFKERVKVVQIRGETGNVREEVGEAVFNGADVLMIDTGDVDDLKAASQELRRMGMREEVRLAFGGSICLQDIPGFLNMDVDILDIGRAIIDAPMLDIRIDVVRVK